MTEQGKKWNVTHCPYCERRYATDEDFVEYHNIIFDYGVESLELIMFENRVARFCRPDDIGLSKKDMLERIIELLEQRDTLLELVDHLDGLCENFREAIG